MKCSKKVVAFALAATMILGSTIGVFAAEPSAEDMDWDVTDNKITFTTGGGDEGTTTRDPEDEEGGEITLEPGDDKIIPTGNNGSLRLDVVPQFDFGSAQITVGDKAYFAELPKAYIGEGTTAEEIPYFAQVTDVRGTGAGWSLNAQMTTEFVNGTHKLDGAQIELMNVAANADPGTTAPSTLYSNVLYYDAAGSSVKIASAAANEGMGVSEVRFGDTTRFGEEMTADESVELTIPADTQIYVGTYTATIKWTLGATP